MAKKAEGKSTGKSVKVKVKLTGKGNVPVYQTSGAAAADIYCVQDVTCHPGEVAIVHTGIRVEIPNGYEMQIRPRSGLAAKRKISVINSPGTIDSDYRGEILVALTNTGLYPQTILAGERVAQAVVAPVTRAEFVVVDALDETGRGEGGFGSTGK